MTDKPADQVNHPAHYGGDTIYECIKVIQAWGLGFDLGSAVKYLCRAGRKDPAKEIEDLEKARFYLDHRIARLKAAKAGEQPARWKVVDEHPIEIEFADRLGDPPIDLGTMVVGRDSQLANGLTYTARRSWSEHVGTPTLLVDRCATSNCALKAFHAYSCADRTGLLIG